MVINKIIFVFLISAVLLTACGTPTLEPGNRVSIKEGRGCALFANYAGEWTGCKPVRLGTGIIETHPGMNTWEYQGRVRVRMSDGEALWFIREVLVFSPPIVAAQK